MKLKMKRTFDEISDEEWENLPHTFDPSRILKKPETTHHHRPQPPPPPIESFAFRPNPKKPQPSPPPSPQTDDDPDFAEISNYCSLEDDDANVDTSAAAPANNRGRRFVVDDDEEVEEEDEDVVEVFDVKSTDDDDEIEEVEFKEEEEEDVVSKALQKCAKISSELKKELFGSSLASCEHYSQVEASSNRIVTQVLFGILLLSLLVPRFVYTLDLSWFLLYKRTWNMLELGFIKQRCYVISARIR